MGYKRKSWQEKLVDKNNLPKVLKLQKKFPCYNAVHKMGADVGDDVVLVNPSEIVDLMERVPKGKVITLIEICKAIANKHRVKACLHIPYWRTLKADGFLNEKYPGGALAQKKLLEREGFTILKIGGKFMVKDFENYITDLLIF